MFLHGRVDQLISYELTRLKSGRDLIFLDIALNCFEKWILSSEFLIPNLIFNIPSWRLRCTNLSILNWRRETNVSYRTLMVRVDVYPYRHWYCTHAYRLFFTMDHGTSFLYSVEYHLLGRIRDRQCVYKISSIFDGNWLFFDTFLTPNSPLLVTVNLLWNTFNFWKCLEKKSFMNQSYVLFPFYHFFYLVRHFILFSNDFYNFIFM